MAKKRIRNANNANGAFEILDDGTTQVTDKADKTKVMQFDVSGLPTGTTRVMKAPAADGALATVQSVVDGNIAANFNFDGSGDIVGITASGLVIGGNQPLTVLQTILPGSSGGSQQILFMSYQAGANEGYSTYLLNGRLGGCQQYASAYANNVLSQNVLPANTWQTYAYVSSGSAGALYLNGSLIPYSVSGGALSGTTYKASIGAAQDGTSAPFSGRVARTVVFNYALSEEKIRRYSSGAKIDYEDVGGSMADLTTNGTMEGAYSSGVAPSWTRMGASSTFADETSIMHSGSHCQKITWITDGDSGIYQTVTYPAVGKLIRMTAWVRSNRAGVLFTLQPNVPTAGTTYTIQSANTWEKAEFIIPCPAAGAGSFLIYVDTQQQAGDIYYIDDVSLTQVGAVLDLEPENITDTTWIDASPNGLHGVVNGAKANRFVPQYSARNHAKNGGMDIWQRGNLLQPNGYTYSADRWNGYIPTGSRHTRTDVSADLPEFKYAVRIQRDSGSTNTSSHNLEQPFESEDLRRLWGKQVTLTFWARAGANFTKTGLDVAAYFGTGTERVRNFANYTAETVALTTSAPLTAAAAFKRFSYTFTVPTGATQGCLFFNYIPTGTAGASDYYDVTGVMWNEGPVAAPFERAGGSLGGELALCQRYCYAMKSDSNANGVFGHGDWAIGNTLCYPFIKFPVKMRANPALPAGNVSAANTFTITAAGAAVVLSVAPSLNQASLDGALVTTTVASGGGTAGTVGRFSANNTINAYMIFDAEL